MALDQNASKTLMEGENVWTSLCVSELLTGESLEVVVGSPTFKEEILIGPKVVPGMLASGSCVVSVVFWVVLFGGVLF